MGEGRQSLWIQILCTSLRFLKSLPEQPRKIRAAPTLRKAQLATTQVLKSHRRPSKTLYFTVFSQSGGRKTWVLLVAFFAGLGRFQKERLWDKSRPHHEQASSQYVRCLEDEPCTATSHMSSTNASSRLHPYPLRAFSPQRFAGEIPYAEKSYIPSSRTFLQSTVNCSVIYLIRHVPAYTGSMRAPSCKLWRSLTNFGEPTSRVPAKVPDIHQSSGEGPSHSPEFWWRCLLY